MQRDLEETNKGMIILLITYTNSIYFCFETKVNVMKNISVYLSIIYYN